MFAMMIVYTRLQRRTALDMQSAQQLARAPGNLYERMQIVTVVLFIITLQGLPLIALFFRSFVGQEGYTLQFYTQLAVNTRDSVLFVPPIQSIGNSLAFALLTTLLTIGLGLISAYLLAERSWLDPVFMLPLATSAVTLGFGFIIALDEPPLNLRTSPILIPMAHTLVALPFMVRSLLPALNSIAPQLRESAKVLGAAPWQILRWIDLPLISRGLIVGATFAFTISMGEFGASLFIARPNTPTMPIVIYRLLSQPGALNLGQAQAMSVLLMLVCGLGFFVIEQIRRSGIGEF
jgi:thiamine transport system permease protein